MASFEKRGKKWRAVVSYTDARGLRQKTSKTFDLKKAATAWAAETETKVNGGLDINAGNISLPKYYKLWTETYKKNTVREATFVKYHSYWLNIQELFADVPLNKLTTQFLQTQMNEFGKTHTKAYSKGFLSSIKSSLKDAQIDGLIDKDIYSRVKPVGSVKHTDDNYLSASEFKKLQGWLYEDNNRLFHDPFYLAVLIAVESGARLGEILALMFSDIDFQSNTINIDKSYSQLMKKVTPPKNVSSVRRVAVSKKLIDVLQWIKSCSNSDKLFEVPIPSNTIMRHMKLMTSELGINQIRFHGLRHSHVSYLLHNNIDISYISKRVGHLNVTITLTTYAHILKEKEQAQDELVLKIMEK